MKNISRLTVAELEHKRHDLDEWIDKLALEVADVNRELGRRFQDFRALCITPARPETARQPDGGT